MYKLREDYIGRLDPNTNEVLQLFQTYTEITDAGYDAGAVCNVCRGRRKLHKGFTWRYIRVIDAANQGGTSNVI